MCTKPFGSPGMFFEKAVLPLVFLEMNVPPFRVMFYQTRARPLQLVTGLTQTQPAAEVTKN